MRGRVRASSRSSSEILATGRIADRLIPVVAGGGVLGAPGEKKGCADQENHKEQLFHKTPLVFGWMKFRAQRAAAKCTVNMLFCQYRVELKYDMIVRNECQ